VYTGPPGPLPCPTRDPLHHGHLAASSPREAVAVAPAVQIADIESNAQEALGLGQPGYSYFWNYWGDAWAGVKGLPRNEVNRCATAAPVIVTSTTRFFRAADVESSPSPVPPSFA